MPAVPKQKPKQSEAKTKQKARKAQGARTDPGGKPLLRRVDRRVDLDAALRRRRRELALEALARVGHERAAAGEHDARPEILAHLLVGRRGVDRPLDERCCRLRECYVCVCVCCVCCVVLLWGVWLGRGCRRLDVVALEGRRAEGAGAAGRDKGRQAGRHRPQTEAEAQKRVVARTWPAERLAPRSEQRVRLDAGKRREARLFFCVVASDEEGEAGWFRSLLSGRLSRERSPPPVGETSEPLTATALLKTVSASHYLSNPSCHCHLTGLKSVSATITRSGPTLISVPSGSWR